MQMVVFHHSEESTDHIKLTTFKAPLLEWSSSLRCYNYNQKAGIYPSNCDVGTENPIF